MRRRSRSGEPLDEMLSDHAGPDNQCRRGERRGPDGLPADRQQDGARGSEVHRGEQPQPDGDAERAVHAEDRAGGDRQHRGKRDHAEHVRRRVEQRRVDALVRAASRVQDPDHEQREDGGEDVVLVDRPDLAVGKQRGAGREIQDDDVDEEPHATPRTRAEHPADRTGDDLGRNRAEPEGTGLSSVTCGGWWSHSVSP
jgi:hypothetical protein